MQTQFKFRALTMIGLASLISLSCKSDKSEAQTPPTSEPPAKVMGWSKAANLGVNLSFTSSESVVGQTDGSSQTYGTSLKGSMNRLSENDEWRNSFSFLAATTRTPSIPRYIKSSDEAKYETIYLYPFSNYPRVAPYVRGEIAAPVFKGEDVRGTTSTYRITNRDPANQLVTGTSLKLTDGFKPVTSKEGVGALYKVVETDQLKVEARSGFGALQIAANNQLSIQGTNAAGEIVVNELGDVNQAGLELGLFAKGKIEEQSGYEFGVETLTPFINNKAAGDDRDAVGLTNIDAFAKLSSNINNWASFGYDYKLKIQPQLQVPAQQIHMLVLNINHNLL